MTAERACRPSLSNFYHCPDNNTVVTQRLAVARRMRRRSVFRVFLISGLVPMVRSRGRLLQPGHADRAFQMATTARGRLRLHLGSERETPRANRETPARERRDTNTTASTERACRPSLSNGYKCPGAPSPSEKSSDAAQFPTEAASKSSLPCAIRSFGQIHTLTFITFVERRTTEPRIAGAYMCEQDSLSEGMRAAKNETHP